MPSSAATLPILISFAAALLALFWISRQISFQIQALVFALTRSSDMATVILFLVFLPGVFIHESAHWLVARLLGLKTGKFRVWPSRRGRSIGLGSVNVQQGGVWLDSLVGLAPLIVGSTLITLIGHRIFNAYELTDALIQGRWLMGLEIFWSALSAEDGGLWAYLLFTIANAMMPSSSDREPAKSVALYTALAALIYLVLGLPIAPLNAALAWASPILEDLTSALIFTLVLDLGVFALFYSVTLVMGIGRR